MDDLLKKHKFSLTGACTCPGTGERVVARQINDDLHFIHVVAGRGSCRLLDEEHRLGRGTVLAIPPYTPFVLDLSPDFEMINFHYRLWLADGSPFEESFSFPVCFRRTDIASLEARLRRMADLWTETGTGSFEAAALAHAIVGEHLCRLGVKDQLRVKTDPAMENLALRLADEREFSFRAPDEARHCGLSVSQMNRRFRQTFGCSPRRFREQKVFTRVCLGLSRSGESIWQVAQKNGFNDEAYFCRWFRRLAGCPPSAFRKRASAAHRAW